MGELCGVRYRGCWAAASQLRARMHYEAQVLAEKYCALKFNVKFKSFTKPFAGPVAPLRARPLIETRMVFGARFQQSSRHHLPYRRIVRANVFRFPRQCGPPDARSQSSMREDSSPLANCRGRFRARLPRLERGGITPPGTTQTGPPPRSAAAMGTSSPASRRMHLDPATGLITSAALLFHYRTMCVSRRRRRRRDGR